MAVSTIEQNKQRYNGYIKYSNRTVSSGSWLTNAGISTEGYQPNGDDQSQSYNLRLSIPGTYLVHCHAKTTNDNQTGTRGIRIYKTEQNIIEHFYHPSGHTSTTMDAFALIDSSGSDNVRLGLYQSSGGDISVEDIFVSVILLH